MSRMGFVDTSLPAAMCDYLRETNPWWSGKPGRLLPRYRRWVFGLALRSLLKGLAPVLVLRGPHQVGKTTLQEQVVRHLLDTEGVAPHRVLRVQFDDLPSLRGIAEPILTIVRWYERAVIVLDVCEEATVRREAWVGGVLQDTWSRWRLAGVRCCGGGQVHPQCYQTEDA